MEKQISKEELALFTVLLGRYILTKRFDYLSEISKNKEKIGEAVTWSTQYLNMLESTGGKNGLKLYAEDFLKIYGKFYNLIKTDVAIEKNWKKMRALQEMDPCKSPHSVSERLKREF